MVAGTANKCLHGLPGVSFVLLSPAGVARARSVRPRSVYLDLTAYLGAAASGSTPFTPAIPATYALDAALDELLEHGVEARQRRYRERVAALDRELARLGLEQLLEPALRSSTIRTVRLPPGRTFGELHDALRREGYVIYAGQGPLAREAFRVAALGNVTPEALTGMCAALERELSKPTLAGATA
jgi:2-aminoethylphosphonate-pyruvate transaminase